MARIKWVDADTVLDVLYQKKAALQLLDNTQAADHIMQGLKIAEDVIRHTTAADVAPVLHGRWVVYKAPDAYHCGLVKCPFCGEEMIAESDEYNYCPHCGAKMDGGTGKGEAQK